MYFSIETFQNAFTYFDDKPCITVLPLHNVIKDRLQRLSVDHDVELEGQSSF